MNFCLLVMASVRVIKGGTLMWQAQGVARACVNTCKVLFVILSHFRPTVCYARGGGVRLSWRLRAGRDRDSDRRRAMAIHR